MSPWLTLGVGVTIAPAIAYVIYELLSMIKTKTENTPVKADPKLEKALSMVELPFKVTAKTVTLIERILLYSGILLGLFLFLNDKRLVGYFVFAGFFFASTFTKRVFFNLARKHKEKVTRELPIFLDAFISLVKSGSTMEQALNDSIHVSSAVYKQMRPVLDDWHNPRGPIQAIGKLEKSDIVQLQLLSGLFMQLAQGGKHAIPMLENYKEQLTQMNHYHRIQNANKKPVYHTLLLMFPFMAAVISWFYPLMIAAAGMFDGFLV